MTLKTLLAVLPQYVLPHHALSQLMSRLTHCENQLWKNLFIKLIIRLYGVDMTEAKHSSLDHYPSFNAFFTRELKEGARPLVADPTAVACPADGAISQLGHIEDGSIFQAKGHRYSATELLGGDEQRAATFKHGHFATIYLSPRDYHRLHMPLTGTLREMIHIPGRLFSVNAITVDNVPNLFARNERVVCIFDTENGPMALVLVGAIFVSSIATVWHGVVTPPSIADARCWRYPDNPPVLAKGEEMGRFNMGSTIIVLFGDNAIEWDSALSAGTPVSLGAAIGHTHP
ncbi:MAG: phosphatidylserine decarboxylase [Methylomonas sp.]|nr:phosphatidylserine decarboxylase [Methylomonas sp.]PPD21856.1 MAG: phosphatidylserine decarboxylase [Methylomonas sp.]PPD27137.1 MAG: phosphatidylserine decarboxylase [Methylomonas sp.]PPD39092.1 MAG: phosphatidylserine decarboxylase [Methylomonas sp.]PPD42319.1 MAG: phosphatidylserine decarboxylase [Methylomonas sp.]